MRTVRLNNFSWWHAVQFACKNATTCVNTVKYLRPGVGANKQEQDKGSLDFGNFELTPFGEKTPSVPPSSLMDTPISTRRDSLGTIHTHAPSRTIERDTSVVLFFEF